MSPVNPQTAAMNNSRTYRFNFLAARTTRDHAITRTRVHVSVACDSMPGEGRSPVRASSAEPANFYEREGPRQYAEGRRSERSATSFAVALMTPRQTHTAATTEDGPVVVTRQPCRVLGSVRLIFGKCAKWSNTPTTIRRGILGHDFFS